MPLAARHAVTSHVFLEVGCGFEHVAQDRLRSELVIARPRNRFAILRKRRAQKVFERFGIRDVGNAVETLFVFHAVGLHVGHGALSRLALLRAQPLARAFKRRLDHGDKVEGVGFSLFGVEQLERRKQKRGKRLVEREIIGNVHRGPVFDAAVVRFDALHHARVDQGGEHLVGAHVQLLFLFGLLRRIVDRACARAQAHLHLAKPRRAPWNA